MAERRKPSTRYRGEPPPKKRVSTPPPPPKPPKPKVPSPMVDVDENLPTKLRI
ncbi:hypothetical protein MMC30_001005, partial [Trapelia coarctata]|nr:hypothetical protein [Trapelia coarctata]